MPSSTTPEKIILVRPAHVYYTHKNLEQAHEFYLDFGFAEAKRVGDDKIYYRGYGPESFVLCASQGSEDEFGGVAFVVETEADLEKAVKTIPGASEVYELKDAPGGGRCVTFKDPVDGFPFHLVLGQEGRVDERKEPEFEDKELPNGNPMKLRFNFPEDKQRPVGQFQRFKKAPAPVYKLGHFGLCITDFAKAFEFYTTRFNFYPSELIHNPEGKDFNTFCRLDRGSELVDHHCFFFFEGPKFHIHHSSFETHDFDTQVLGHDWLRHKGYELSWGVGRHIMGSQIFDYWFDPSKFIMEHYVDGDLVDNSTPTQKSAAGKDRIHIWGPDLPEGFLD